MRVLLLLASLIAACGALAEQDSVLWIEVNGYISPGTVRHFEEAFAVASRYSAVLVTIDTLGGQADSMLSIVELIQRSPVPVIGFVYPEGGKAMSAGAYILMATDFAAMAPGTIIGSGQPVSGGQPVTDSKILNFFAEKMGTLAELHGRNRTEAVKIVLENKNFNPTKAYEAGLIEAIAADIDELLKMADGRTVTTLHGEKVLRLAGASVVKKEPSLSSSLTSILSDPLVASMLISVGILALIVGLANPGWGGELLGGVLIVLGLVGLGLNINLAGALLAIIGAGLLLYEILSPGFGVAGVGGVVLITLGVVLLGGYSPAPTLVSQEWLSQLQLSVVVVAVFVGAFLGFLAYKSLSVQRKKPAAFMPTGKGRAVDEIPAGSYGYVFVDGEYWRAKAVKDVKKDQVIKIVGREDGVFLVEPGEST
jgi:membrane-bound serine protease (ClpP class)